jgi:hypothetical protein
VYKSLQNRPRFIVLLQLRLETALAPLKLTNYICVDLRVQDRICEADDKIKSVFFQTTVMVRKSSNTNKQKEKDTDEERHIKGN